MLEKILNNKYKIVAVLFLVALLALVRAFEQNVFYDPFLVYFKNDFSNKPLPTFDSLQLFLGTIARYALNSFLSLLIIYTIFRETEMVKFATLLYVVFFIILIGAFYMLLSIENPPKMYIFYVRRFLIQPLFLLLFVPAFYFQNLQKTY